MRKQILLVGLVALVAWPAISQAQSLAAVARTEEARRKAVKEPVKVYTNEDLKPTDDTGSPAAATAAGAAAGTVATTTDTPAAADSGPAKDEKYWHDRITTARDTLSRNKVLADALQTRINALTTDFVNTADPAQRAVVEGNRKTALSELDRMNKEIDGLNKEVASIQDEARKASVPSGWLR